MGKLPTQPHALYERKRWTDLSKFGTASAKAVNENKTLTTGKELSTLGKCAKKQKCYERRSHCKQCNKFEDSQLSCEMP